MQIMELVLLHYRGSVQHEVLGSLGLGEGDDVANILGIGQQHHKTVDPRGNTPMGGRSVVEGLKKMPEALFDFLRLVAKHLEKVLLDRAVMDANRAYANS
jgi:hypothetical protein